MNPVIKILMERDGVSEAEAKDILFDVKQMIEESPDDVEEIIIDELGLEMDYIFDIIFWCEDNKRDSNGN